MMSAERRGYQVGFDYKGAYTSPEAAGKAEHERLYRLGYAHVEPAEDFLRGFVQGLTIRQYLLRQTGANNHEQ